MTESEAKTKWCPMVRSKVQRASDGEIIYTFYSNGTNEGNCIGSDCMMWQWVRPSREVIDEARAVGFEHMAKSHGYCGLAGKP